MNELQVFKFNDLVKINEETKKTFTTSLDIANVFGKEHKHVLESIRSTISTTKEYFNETNFRPVQYKDNKGEMRPYYELTRDGFTLLVMGYTGEKAMKFKAMYIEAFNKMEEEIKRRNPAQNLSPKELAYMVIRAEEEKERLMIENKMQKQIITEYEPKVSYYDNILQSKDLLTITQIAHDYDLSGTKLNRILNENHIQYNQGGMWLLYNEHQGKGYTKTTTHSFKHKNGDDGAKILTKWTQKGRIFIHQLLEGLGITALMDR